MILESLRTLEIGDPFKKLVEILVYRLPAGIIALVGDNGQGKTHILELLFGGTLYRWFVSYDEALGAHVNPGARNAMSELVWRMEDGRRLMSRVQCDPQLGKTEHYLHQFTEEGWHPLGGPRLREYDEALAKILPPLDFMTASVFAPAGGEGSILSRSPADRKAFFMRMTGNDELEVLSVAAREKGKALLPDLEAMKRRIPELEGRAARLNEARGKIAAIEMERSAAEADIAKAQAVLDAAAQKHLEESTRIAAEKAEHEAKIVAHKVAADRKAQFLSELLKIRGAWAEKSRQHKAACDASDALNKQTKAIGLPEAEAGFQTIFKDWEAKAQELNRARIDVEAETVEWTKLAALTHNGKELRARAERLQAKAANVCDICPLGEELRQTQAALEQARDEYRLLPENIEKRPKYAAMKKLEEALRDTEQGSLAKARKAVEEKRKQSDALEQLRAQAAQIVSLKKDLDELAAQGRAKNDEHEAIKIPDIAEYTPARAQELAAAEQSMGLARRAVEEAQAAYKASLSEWGVQMGVMRTLGDPEVELAEIAKIQSEKERESTDWRVVEKSCGRDGAQALVIDSLGGEVTEIINELLVAGWDSRFQVVIETLAPKADGGQKEVFDIRLLDTTAGVTRRQGSTGQMVIIDEAIRLGLAIYNVRKSGVPLRTLFRDEAVGALSQVNANRYIKMLRRAMEIGGFHQTFFVSHHEDVWSQADARLFVEGGQVRADT